MSEATSRRIRAVFGAANFWAIVLYNILALNSLEFALLVTRRLLVTGKVPMAFYPTEQSLSWWADMGCGGCQVLLCPKQPGYCCVTRLLPAISIPVKDVKIWIS